MITTTTHIREAVRRRTAAVLEAFADRGVNEADLHTAFTARFRDRNQADAAWLRVRRLKNPTAGDLMLFAETLQINTSWLLTGNMKFANTALLCDTCLCWLLPVEKHALHGSIAAGAERIYEFNPDCLVHGPSVVELDRLYALAPQKQQVLS